MVCLDHKYNIMLRKWIDDTRRVVQVNPQKDGDRNRNGAYM